jgi:hypothetical protein
MSGRGKYDYDELEKLFIQTEPSVSIRAFAKEHDVPWSAMNVQANQRDWRAKRDQFHARATEKAIAVAGDQMGKKIMEIRSDALDVIHAAILKMAADMQDRTIDVWDHSRNVMVKQTVPGQVITPSDMAKLIDKLLLLTGNPTAISEERNERVTFDFSKLGPELTRAIADVAGERVSERRAVVRSPLPGARSTGPN